MAKGLSGLDKNVEAIGSIAITVGIVLIVLAKFGDSAGNATANTTIQTIITAIATVGDWVGIIIVITVAGILMYMYKNKGK